MQSQFNEIVENARKLPRSERAELAHVLIAELDEGPDENVEALWAAEAQSRWEAYKSGEITAHPGDEVMARLRGMLK